MKAKFTLVESAEKNTLNVSGDLAGKANLTGANPGNGYGSATAGLQLYRMC
jgi:hypothetical protein